MANRYGNLTPSKKISEDFQNINIGFDRVQADMDANKTAADDHIANADIHVTKAQKAEWDSKASGSTATELTSHIDDQVVHVTQADHDKLDSIEDGAEVNQNAFAKVNDIAAADPSSQFFIVGGVGIKVTTNPNNGEVTITATGDATPGAHGSTHTEHGADPIPTATLTEGGLLSAAQLAEIVTHGELLEEQGEAITALETRLDTADTDEITLQPGLQVVSAAKDARFNLGSIKGKSEINGSGRIGIVGVENPYVIRYGENLLPSFFEVTLDSGHRAIAPYELYVQPNIAAYSVIQFKVVPNKEYCISLTGSNFEYSIFPVDLNDPSPPVSWTVIPTYTFNSGNNQELRLLIRSKSSTLEAVVKYPMLTIGTEAKPFQPREDSMLAFQTELHANPDTGADPDVLFEREGQYFKLEKWKKVVLDGYLNWAINANKPGFKQVRYPVSDGVTADSTNSKVTKYDGTVLQVADSNSIVDKYQLLPGNGYFYISVSNTDTGWGDAYTPTADEIKAYFMGWRMMNADNWTAPYNGTGTKGWYKFDKNGALVSGSGTRTLPTTINEETGQYNLLYRLAKETVEPVVSEGCLTLNEGDNVVEVGTGIVLRERANATKDSDNKWNLGNPVANPGATAFKHKARRIGSIYADGRLDVRWKDVSTTTYGNIAQLDIMYAFDPSAAYSVTYLKLDKSPVVPITGLVAVNEKAQLSDLTAGMAEALHGVSVLFNEKAEKDAPGWIALTLLNTWTVYGGYPTLSVRKDSDILYFEGLIKGGVYSPTTIIAHLPDGYRPRVTKVVSVPCLTGEGMYSIAHLFIRSDGTIAIFSAPGNEYLSFAELSIPLN